MNFRYKLMQFFSGRYGIDQLFWVLFAVSMIFAFINLFLGSIILQILVYLFEIIAIVRALSRNHMARRNENQKILGILNFFKRKSANFKQKHNDKEHIYRTCPACKATLRLPRKKGKHSVKCPKCSFNFKVRVF